MTAAAPSLRDALPHDLRRRIGLAFPFDWDVARPFCLPPAAGFGAYYIQWDAGNGIYGEDWDLSPRDAAGVLLTHGRAATYHPIRIAQYALYEHAKFVGGDAAARDRFLAQARWLRDRQNERGAYTFPFPWPKYGAAIGWTSAMAQGEAISVLVRAEAIAAEGYADAALRAAEPFRLPYGAGGVVARTGRDAFPQEAAVEPPAHILNGGIYAVFGLWDLLRLGAPAWVQSQYDDALETIARRLPEYDSGDWSYYSALKTPRGYRAYATLKYHAFHVAQLKVLAAMSGERMFDDVAERWLGYQRSYVSRAALVGNEVRGLWARLVTHADAVPGGARAFF